MNCWTMKKLRIGGKKKNAELFENDASSDTINRIVSKKEQEKEKWRKQHEEFERKKREHELQLVEMERKEVQRRKDEIRTRKELLEEKRKKHQQIENDIVEQRQTLIEKLEGYRTEHQSEDNEIVEEIREKKEKIKEVRTSLRARMKELELLDETDSTSLRNSSISQEDRQRKSLSVPNPQDMSEKISSTNASYSTLTIDKGVLKLENSMKLVEENEELLSNDILRCSSTSEDDLQVASNQVISKRGSSPPPSYYDANEIIIEPIEFLHDDTVPKSKYYENTSPIHSETEHEADNVFIDEISFTPLISPPITKKVLPSEWKMTTSSPIRTRRLYGTSNFSDENGATREIYNRSTKTNLPSYERPSFKLRSPFVLPKLDLPDAMTKENSTDHELEEEDFSSDTVHENPSSSTLQHLVKDKPKRQKKHASNKNVILSQ